MRELGARDVRIHLIYCSREKLDSWDKKDRYYVPRVSYRAQKRIHLRKATCGVGWWKVRMFLYTNLFLHLSLVKIRMAISERIVFLLLYL